MTSTGLRCAAASMLLTACSVANPAFGVWGDDEQDAAALGEGASDGSGAGQASAGDDGEGESGAVGSGDGDAGAADGPKQTTGAADDGAVLDDSGDDTGGVADDGDAAGDSAGSEGGASTSGGSDDAGSDDAGSDDAGSGSDGATTGGAEAGSGACDGPASLVACWDFEVVGAGVVQDESGHGNDAQADNVSIVEGQVGANAARLDASSELRVEDSASLDVTELTVDLWVRPFAYPLFTRDGLLDDDGQYGLFLLPGGTLRCRVAAQDFDAGHVPLGTWSHVACAASDGQVRLYVDGGLVEVQDFDGDVATASVQPTAIGNESPSWSQAMNGDLDLVRVWNVGLSSAEICEAAGGGGCGGGDDGDG